MTPDEGLTTEEAVTTVPGDQEKCVRDMECTRCLELNECKFITFKVRTLSFIILLVNVYQLQNIKSILTFTDTNVFRRAMSPPQLSVLLLMKLSQRRQRLVIPILPSM